MNVLNGVYNDTIPESITGGIPGLTLSYISDRPEDWKKVKQKEQINFLIVRQGVVNEMLKDYPNVRWIQLRNAGFEEVDLELLKRREILLTNARSIYSATIAEDVIAKLLILARRYQVHFLDQQKHFWPNDDQLPNGNLDLYGRVLGVLGVGAIGREIAIRAKVFGLKVRGYDPYVAHQEGFEEIYQGEGALERLLAESDFVVTSLPVTDDTRDVINAKTLAMMKPTAYLINVARGQIIREEDLIRALNSGTIAGAFLDVAKTEPLPEEDPLWTAKNLLITPHRAAYGDQMRHKMCALIEENVHRYLAGQPLKNRIL